MINPLPLLLHPLLNTTTLTYDLDCWQQNPPSQPQLTPIIYKQCREIITQIPMGEKSLAPVVFSRSSTAGFQVPESWQYGNCVVSINVEGDGDDDDVQETSTFAAITKRAFALMVNCVIKEPHLGGKSFVGDGMKLEVSVFGV